MPRRLKVSLRGTAAAMLAGTGWQLVAIRSMDDAQGTTRVAELARFMLRFGADDRASLRLDCNRGMGEYRLTPAGAGSSGSLMADAAICEWMPTTGPKESR